MIKVGVERRVGAERGGLIAVVRAQDQFRAAASALGYAYQFRRSLLRAWQELSISVDWQIAVEGADDVEFIDESGAEHHQLKHRAAGAVLQDASDDLWKTLRVWAESFTAGRLDLARTRLALVTTAAAANGTIAMWLSSTPECRDVDAALDELDSITAKSENTSPSRQKAHSAWNAISRANKRLLLGCINVYSNEPDITEIGAELLKLATLSTRRADAPAFLETLEGWWFQQCLRLMAASGGTYIGGDEVDAYVSYLRERFVNPDDLAVAPWIELLHVADQELYSERTFAKQVRLAGVSNSRLHSAVSDYLRAYTQRSQWVRQGQLYPDQLNLYERRLQEEWRLVFDRQIDELGHDAAEADKVRVAKDIYAWVEAALAPPIRLLCTERFLIRGSLHILAEKGDAGWHPDFMARLFGLLEPAGTN